MKIAFFIKSFYGGGAERVAVNLANELSKRHEVTIIVAIKSGAYLHTVSPSVQIVTLSRPAIRHIAFELHKLQEKIQFEVLVSNLVHENIFASIGWIRCKDKFKLVKVEHNKIMDEIAIGSKFKIKITKILWFITKNIGSITLGVSKGVANNLNLNGVKNVGHVYNPIITYADISKKIRHVNTRDKKLLFVGRLVRQKNPHLAIEILKMLHDQGQMYKLTFAGEGPLKSELIELAESHALLQYVDFLGFVDNLQKVYLDNKFLLLTSNFEGFGNVLVESAYHGCIPIARNVEFGPNEILTSLKIGKLIEERNSKESFCNFITNSIEYFDLGFAQAELEDKFSVKNVCMNYEKIFESISK